MLQGHGSGVKLPVLNVQACYLRVHRNVDMLFKLSEPQFPYIENLAEML